MNSTSPAVTAQAWALKITLAAQEFSRKCFEQGAQYAELAVLTGPALYAELVRYTESVCRFPMWAPNPHGAGLRFAIPAGYALVISSPEVDAWAWMVLAQSPVAGGQRPPALDLASMTWTCMVCHDERPDARINVAHRPIPGMEARFPDAETRVRYCNDRVACVATATADGPWPLAGSVAVAVAASAYCNHLLCPATVNLTVRQQMAGQTLEDVIAAAGWRLGEDGLRCVEHRPAQVIDAEPM